MCRFTRQTCVTQRYTVSLYQVLQPLRFGLKSCIFRFQAGHVLVRRVCRCHSQKLVLASAVLDFELGHVRIDIK